MIIDLSDKTAIVTGSTGGIGLAIASGLAATPAAWSAISALSPAAKRSSLPSRRRTFSSTASASTARASFRDRRRTLGRGLPGQPYERRATRRHYAHGMRDRA